MDKNRIELTQTWPKRCQNLGLQNHDVRLPAEKEISFGIEYGCCSETEMPEGNRSRRGSEALVEVREEGFSQSTMRDCKAQHSKDRLPYTWIDLERTIRDGLYSRVTL